MTTFRSTIFASALVFLLGSGVQAQNTSGNPETLQVRTTAYTHTEADHIKYAKSTASGTQLRADAAYTSAASDWSVFPLGTVFRIKGMDRNFVIDDYGSALVGSKTIDLYKPNRAQMKGWGVKHVEIEIIKFGSFEKSLKLLSGRVKYAHCKQMHSAIKRQIQS